MLAGCTGGLLARMLPAMRMQGKTAVPHATTKQHNNTAKNVEAEILQPAHMLAGQAVALHALAGKSLAEQWPLRGNTPSAVADALPHALSTYAGSFAADNATFTDTRDQKDDILPWPR